MSMLGVAAGEASRRCEGERWHRRSPLMQGGAAAKKGFHGILQVFRLFLQN